VVAGQQPREAPVSVPKLSPNAAPAADAVQRPLRSRFPARLSCGVDMTANVKSRQQLFLGLHDVFFLRASEEVEPVRTTVDYADIRGLATTLLGSVGCLPRSRHEGFLQPLHAVEGDTLPGRRLFRWTLEPFYLGGALASSQSTLGCYRNLFGNGPHEPH
jgi:hypothetical protein